MFSEFISLIVGVVIGQDAGLPRVRPLINELYTKCIEMLNTRAANGNMLMDSLTGWFKKDE